MNIWFVKWGNKYSSSDVNRLCEKLKGYRPDYNYTCLTEDPMNLECDAIPLPKMYRKVWGKMYLFSKARTGRNIFFDIDNEITSDPFDIIEEMPLDNLTVVDCPWKQTLYYREHSYDVMINSQVMGWEGDYIYIYEHFMERWQYYVTKYKGIDRFLVYENIDMKGFPHELVTSVKYQNGTAPIKTYEEIPNFFHRRNRIRTSF